MPRVLEARVEKGAEVSSEVNSVGFMQENNRNSLFSS